MAKSGHHTRHESNLETVLTGNCSRKRELEGTKDHDRKGNEARNTI